MPTLAAIMRIAVRLAPAEIKNTKRQRHTAYAVKPTNVLPQTMNRLHCKTASYMHLSRKLAYSSMAAAFGRVMQLHGLTSENSLHSCILDVVCVCFADMITDTSTDTDTGTGTVSGTTWHMLSAPAVYIHMACVQLVCLTHALVHILVAKPSGCRPGIDSFMKL